MRPYTKVYQKFGLVQRDLSQFFKNAEKEVSVNICPKCKIELLLFVSTNLRILKKVFLAGTNFSKIFEITFYLLKNVMIIIIVRFLERPLSESILHTT